MTICDRERSDSDGAKPRSDFGPLAHPSRFARMTALDADLVGFQTRMLQTDSVPIFVREAGSGPALLLLHGFPQTGLMWHRVAPILADDFTVIVADLPGYGRSGCPADTHTHASMSKREMAKTLVRAMANAGHDHFAVVGHDRGGRVAYRAALDSPDCIRRVAVLDVVPTYDVWDRADDRLALAFWPFSLLAQPSPLPERLIAAAPDSVVDNAINEWGSSRDAFPDWVRGGYVDALRDPAHVHTICEEYRAAAGIDRADDEADLAAGRKIGCPLLALWSSEGGLATWYDDTGGPLALWRRWAENVQGEAIQGGHFFPEEASELTATKIREFLKV